MSLGSLYFAASHRPGAGTSAQGPVPLPAARRQAGQLLAVGLACLLALALLGWVFVRKRVGQRLDGDLLPSITHRLEAATAMSARYPRIVTAP